MNPYLLPCLPEGKSWHADALCRKVGRPDDWFADQKVARDVDPAATCQECPVIKQCAQAALNQGERWGVWAGVHLQAQGTLAERRQQLREVLEA